MADWKDGWADEDFEYHLHASGRVMRSELGAGDFYRTSYDEGARAMLAELQRRAEAIAALKRLNERQASEIRHRRRHQLDGKAIGRGIVEALLPGVTLTKDDLDRFAMLMGPSGRDTF